MKSGDLISLLKCRDTQLIFRQSSISKKQKIWMTQILFEMSLMHLQFEAFCLIFLCLFIFILFMNISFNDCRQVSFQLSKLYLLSPSVSHLFSSRFSCRFYKLCIRRSIYCISSELLFLNDCFSSIYFYIFTNLLNIQKCLIK